MRVMGKKPWFSFSSLLNCSEMLLLYVLSVEKRKRKKNGLVTYREIFIPVICNFRES